MKISKNKLLSIIKEEIDNVIREMNGLPKYRLMGTEEVSSNEVELIKDMDGFVVVRIIGTGFEQFKAGTVARISKELFDNRFVKTSTEDGKRINTVNLQDTGETPSDVLRSFGYVSEGLKHHILTNKPLTENVYRIGSDAYFETFKEARVAYKKGIYKPLNEEEREALDSDLGEWVMFEGESVPLDFPMYVETLDEKKKKKKKDPPIGKPMKGSGGKKYQVYVKNKKTGRIKKISYGDSKGGLKGNWNSAEARKSFASRHNCAEKKDRTKAGYWACRAHKDFGTNVPGRFW